MSSDQPYTPSEAEVRLAYADRRLFQDQIGRREPSTDAVYNAAFDRFLARVRRDAARGAVLDLAEDYRLRAEEALSDEDTNLASTLTGEHLSIRERALTEYPEETP